ncbi:hypothetical protein [Streptomyces sp. NPDC001744]|uniref:hypothetical protein n=1 Tax=Streptomyces sp. NPDC001744 TaxID=3364606 RepID=UPI0036868A94
MTDPIQQDPLITTKDMHATSEPAIGAITAKITAPAGETLVTKDMHATSEPAVGAITEKVTGDEVHTARPVD